VRLNRLLRTLLRRWYVLVAVGALTAAGLMLVARPDGVYATRVSVVFLGPAGQVNDNSLTPTPATLVHFAAIIERQYNGEVLENRFAAPSATLYGSGVRVGHSVTLVNRGGQWGRAFSDPVLSIDVVDSSEERVLAVLDETVERVTQLSEAQQERMGVSEGEAISTLRSPQVAIVEYTGGSRARASAGILALGALVGVSGALVLDRALERRSERRNERSLRRESAMA